MKLRMALLKAPFFITLNFSNYIITGVCLLLSTIKQLNYTQKILHLIYLDKQ